MRDRYDRKLFDHVFHLKAQGLTWAQVALRMGLKKNSLEVMVSRYRRGLITCVCDANDETRSTIESLFEAGHSIAEIARAMGVTRSAIANRLDGMGLDAEMRAEIINERQNMRMAA